MQRTLLAPNKRCTKKDRLSARRYLLARERLEPFTVWVLT
jgi:hypothetical protein